VGCGAPRGVSYRIEAGLVVAVVDADGVSSVSNVYDEAGRVVPRGRRSGGCRLQPTPARPHGRRGRRGCPQRFVHDRRGNLTTMVDAYGRPSACATTPMGAWWGSASAGRDLGDDLGRLGEQAGTPGGPEGFEESFEWDREGRIVAHHLGLRKSGHDPVVLRLPEHNHPLADHRARGAGTVIEVSGDDLATSVTDADGVRAEMAYDATADDLAHRRLATRPPRLRPLRQPRRLALPLVDHALLRLRSRREGAAGNHPQGEVELRVVGAGGRLRGWTPRGAVAARHATTGRSPRSPTRRGGRPPSPTTPAATSSRSPGDGRVYRQGFDGLSSSSLPRPRGSTGPTTTTPRRAGRHRRAGGGGDAPGRRPPRAHEEEPTQRRTWRRVWGAGGHSARVVDPAGWALSTLRRRRAPGRGHRRRRGPRKLLLVAGGAPRLRGGRLGLRLLPLRRRRAPRGGRRRGGIGQLRPRRRRPGAAGHRRAGPGPYRRARRGGPALRVIDRRGRIHHLDSTRGDGRRGGDRPASASFSYDERGLLASAADPSGRRRGFSYDPAGASPRRRTPSGARPLRLRPGGSPRLGPDALGAVSRLLRDPTGALVGVAWPDGGGGGAGPIPPGSRSASRSSTPRAPMVRVELDPAGRPVACRAAGRHGVPGAATPRAPPGRAGPGLGQPRGTSTATTRRPADRVGGSRTPPVTWRYDPGDAWCRKPRAPRRSATSTTPWGGCCGGGMPTAK